MTREGPWSFLYSWRGKVTGVSFTNNMGGTLEFLSFMAREGTWSFLYLWRGKVPGVSSIHDEGGTLQFPPLMTRRDPTVSSTYDEGGTLEFSLVIGDGGTLDFPLYSAHFSGISINNQPKSFCTIQCTTYIYNLMRYAFSINCRGTR
jgi:hypothetical protein